ncbi:unnamed protein product [Ectocarpus sp. 12 AP-2014]
MKLLWCLFALLPSGGDSFVSPFVPAAISSATTAGRGRSQPLEARERAAPRTRATRTAMSVSREQRTGLGAAVASWTLAAVLMAAVPLLVNPSPVAAISGGGLDYAGLNLTGQDLSNGKYKSKDFSGSIAKEVNFSGSDLRGVRFFKADLKKADFTGANLGTASLEEADLEGTIMTNAVATGSYFGNNMNNVGDISGADFTDALIRKDVAKILCARPDAKGTNPTTGTDTRDSLLCDMF